jgi:endogenous inhibitor of DNA gyrase (YacG/DUF329 family)
MDPEKMIMKWVCPECHKEVLWSYMDLVNVGNPICSDCDVEMELLEDEE